LDFVNKVLKLHAETCHQNPFCKKLDLNGLEEELMQLPSQTTPGSSPGKSRISPTSCSKGKRKASIVITDDEESSKEDDHEYEENIVMSRHKC